MLTGVGLGLHVLVESRVRTATLDKGPFAATISSSAPSSLGCSGGNRP
jgi:hypothetical protein